MSTPPEGELSPAAQALIEEHLRQSTPGIEEHDRVWQRVQHSMLPLGVAATSNVGRPEPSPGPSPSPSPSPSPAAEAATSAQASAGVAKSSVGAGAAQATAAGGAASGAVVGGIVGSTVAKVALALGISSAALGVGAYQQGYFEKTAQEVAKVEPVAAFGSSSADEGAELRARADQDLPLPLRVEPPAAPGKEVEMPGGKSAGKPVGKQAPTKGEARAGTGLRPGRSKPEMTPALLAQLRALSKIDDRIRAADGERARRALQDFYRIYPSSPFEADLRALELILQCQREKVDEARMESLRKDPRLRRYRARIDAACRAGSAPAGAPPYSSK